MTRQMLRLDLQMFAQEKTEKATPKKRQESRKKGQVAKSMELPSAFILFFGFLLLFMLGGFLKERIFELFTATFHHYLLWDVTMESVGSIFSQLMLQGFITLAPILIMAMVVAVLGNYLQIGFLMSGDPLKMKWNKLNPIKGVKGIVSLRSLVEFLKTMLKLSIVSYVVYSTLYGEKDQIIALAHLPLESIMSYTARVTLLLGLKIGLVLVIMAIFDYMYQRYEYEKKLRMSKQDVKDEHKKTEGDPLIKGKIRDKQRRMALQRMMQEVAKADVVITNPTHYAVALRYDAGQMEAPLVVAKGLDFVALRIKETAGKHGVVTMENKPLARALYSGVEIGQAIPPDLFHAVAEVLAYVYQLKGTSSS